MDEALKDADKIELETLELLRTIPDPELDVNIVDLGLIYEITHDSENNLIKILLTFTTPGCPMGDTILTHIETAMSEKFPDKKIDTRVTWEPEWSTDFISEEGKQMLGGF